MHFPVLDTDPTQIMDRNQLPVIWPIWVNWLSYVSLYQ